MKNAISRLAAWASAAMLVPGFLGAAVLESKTLTRGDEAVVLKGTQCTAFYNLQVNNADPTLAPNQIFAWAYDATTGWRQVVFQIDEINNAYPVNPPPITTGNCHYGRGPNHMDGDDGLWDANDELVFMSGEAGDRVSLDEWAPGAATTAPRYEIAVTDPQDTSKKGWVYIFRHDGMPTWRNDDYVAWNETTNTVSALDYTVDYPDSHTNAVYFSTLAVTAAGGGSTGNMVQKSRLYWYGGFAFSCGSDETAIRTLQTITGGGCGDYSLPWYAKDGRVRVLRYFVWSPYCVWVSNGIGMWPSTHIYYYRNFWREDSNVSHHGGSGHTDYWWSTVNHANTTAMTFYDSNGEAAAIDGTAETLANTPLWTWYQVSSAYGSYVQVLRDTARLVSPDNRRNLYTDNGTGQRGDAGYRIENPTETTEDVWHQFWFFLLPSDSANVGAAYDGYVNAPLTTASASQNFVVPPQNFDGILSATDINGACLDQGVEVTWDNTVDWNDGCSASCTSRRFVLYRSGVKVRDETNLTLSAWIDTTGTNRTTYNYGVEACNQNNNCTALGTTLPGVDYVSAAPTLASPATTAADHDACIGDGIDLSWAAPSDWMDNGEGSRRYDLYWEVDAYAAPILTNQTSPVIYDAADGVSHQYRVRAVNGCGLFANYASSAGVTDQVGADPTLPANPQVMVADLNSCSPTGVQVSWNPVSPWGDNGSGSRKYDVYWSRNAFATPIVTNATSPVAIVPPDAAPTAYRVIAANGCSRTAAYTDGTGADNQTAPNFAGVQSVTDSNGCAASPVTIAWTDVNGDGPTGWNDGGSGPGARVYRIFRDGTEITGSPVPDGISSITDLPPATNTSYAYLVQAVNLDGCYTAGGGALPGTDLAGAAPTASPAQTLASDECDRGEAPAQGIRITWDAPGDWGDHGVNPSNRRYLLYYSGNNYSAAIAAVPDGTLSLTYNPPDNVPYAYRITARNGCSLTRTYAVSVPVFDKTSCAPSCTVPIDDDFTTSDHFVQNCFSHGLWTKTAGVGNGGTQGWLADLASSGHRNQYACLRLSSNLTIMWTSDVKLRFWSASALPASDAGVVEIWTDDSAQWRKITTLIYPAQDAAAPNTLDDGTGSCANNLVVQNQPAFQGAVAGMFYEVRLDDYLTPATTQINIGFRAASDGTNNASMWTIDDVMIGYGIADSVWWWSLGGDLSAGVVKSGTADAAFSWEDGGSYLTDEFRIYRSANPAAIRTDGTSVLIHAEPDTDAAGYSWTTTEGAPAGGTCWYYKIYGYKDPCGESNQGEN